MTSVQFSMSGLIAVAGRSGRRRSCSSVSLCTEVLFFLYPSVNGAPIDYTTPIHNNDSGWCGVVWDNILCWNRTRAGTVAKQSCPAYITHFRTSEFAERTCTENGTWWFSADHNVSWTNFSKCLIPPLDIRFHANQANNLVRLYTTGYSISLASLIVAVIIMLYSRRLRGKSTTLHINLFIAFILRASMSFMKDRLFVYGLGLPRDVRVGQAGLDFIHEGIHWECRALFVLLMFAISASQTWMLMEGLYLYMMVHKTMIAERLGVMPYIILGWASPWSFLIPWIVVKAVFENTYCWNMQESPVFFWILKGPWTAIVLVNFIFFLDIIRVLTTRERNKQRHAGRSQYRKVGKFILVLIPLFGIMYIVLNVAFPSEVQGLEYNVVYLYIEMGYNSFQGFVLALLFCFLNEHVHLEMRRSWQRHISRRYDSNSLHRSTAQTSWRKSHRSLKALIPTHKKDSSISCQRIRVDCKTRTGLLPNGDSTSYKMKRLLQMGNEDNQSVTLSRLEHACYSTPLSNNVELMSSLK